MKNNLNQPAILFDVDSTLVTIEGIDYLAQQKGVGEQVTRLTHLAMNGDFAMHEAMKIKLDLVKPNYSDTQILGQAYINDLVPHAKPTIQTLQQRGHAVYLISGGLAPAIQVLARFLTIPANHVFASRIDFGPNGEYQGFDATQILVRNHGKAQVIGRIKPKPYQPIFIGDGATDLETKPVVRAFIGFGGVVVREKVLRQADYYLYDLKFKSLCRHIDQIVQLK